ncbi:MAG TPA: adenylate/guanylate cyclase domain-containing protein [Gemmatimonadota bacterium]|nr:adenylate/guanylate cyclase domain-containing protein [Gemmatimonadota bacterium]
MAVERSLATVLFTDIVGSTERAAGMGDEAWHALLDRHHAVVRRWLKRFAGREVKTAGDGFLVVFDSPSRALTCADAIRNSIRELGLEVRCGLHMGEIEHKEGDVGGLAVHIGSRVASIAGPSEVLVSSTVVDAEAGSGFRFEERGRHELKGVPGQWRVHALVGVPEEAKVALLEAVEEQSAGGRGNRVRRSHLVRTLLAYVGIAALLLFATDQAVDRLGLPGWAFPGAVVLLVLGFVVTAATAWIQSSPETRIRTAGGELPRSRALDLGGLAGAIRRGEMPHLTWGRTVAGGVFAFSLLFGLAGLYVVIRDRGRSFAPTEAIAEAAPGIAVLPFTVQGGADLEVWREGMVDLLSTNLDGVGGLRAIDSRTVLARWNESVPEGQRADLATALEVGRSAGARYVLLGSAVSLGSDVRLSAELYDVEGGERLGQGQAVGSPDSVLVLVDRLSIEILRAVLQGKEGDLPDVNLARATTTSLPALKAFLEAEVLFRRGDFEAAIPAYERAVEADSTFAMANWRLATSYGWAETISSELGVGAIDRAARHADRLPEHEAVLLRADYALTHGTLDGIAPLEREVRRRPDDAEGWYILGETYWHLGAAALIPLAKAEEAFARAVQLDPRFLPAYLHRVDYAMLTADSARAAVLVDSISRIVEPGSEELELFRAVLALGFGDAPAKEKAWRTMEANADEIMTIGLQDFRHPGFRDVEVRLYDIAAAGGSVNAVTLAAWNELHRGRPRAALERVKAPGVLPVPRIAILMTADIQGIPVPAEEIDEALAVDQAELLSDVGRAVFFFFKGVRAADEDREADRASARGALRDLSARARVGGDSATARFADGGGLALDGLLAWKRGNLEVAEEFLEEARVEATGYGPQSAVNDAIRWWLAEILVEQGKLHEAEPYFSSLRSHTMSDKRRGDLYAELGETDQAREAYERFLTAWRDAEPEMAPIVAPVRQALAGMAPLRRE